MNIRNLKLTLILAAVLTNTGCRKEQERPLRIAIASNLRFAADSLVAGFNRLQDIPCEVIPGSSGKLYAQIKEGAPYDLFLSADLIYPEALQKAGLTEESPEVFAYGSLILWSLNPEINPSFDILKTDRIRHISMANPRTAPYGRAAWEAIKFYGLEDELSNKLVYGESLSQADQFLLSGSADIGFTSLSVAQNSDFRKLGSWIPVDPAAYTALPHGAVLLKNKEGVHSSARAFYQYLFSVDGRNVLKNFGYSVRE
jgi:molybdate transport system substrate-binding protein